MEEDGRAWLEEDLEVWIRGTKQRLLASNMIHEITDLGNSSEDSKEGKKLDAQASYLALTPSFPRSLPRQGWETVQSSLTPMASPFTSL